MRKWPVLICIVVIAAGVVLYYYRPQTAAAYCEKAVELMEQEKWDEAIPLLQKSIKADPAYPKANYALAVAYARKQPPDPASARLYLEKAKALRYHVPEWFERYLERLEKGK